MLGEPGEGFAIAMQILNNGRMSLGSGSVGGARRMLDLSITHTRKREQFGRSRPIGSIASLRPSIQTPRRSPNR